MGTTTGKKNKTKAASEVSDVMDPQVQLKEIQQLLFGEQIASVNRTIEHLDKQNQKQFDSIDKLIHQSIETLKQDLNHKLDDLSQHVAQLNDASQNHAALIEDDVSALQQDLNAFKQQTEDAEETLEKLLFSEAEKLAADMEAKYKELNEQLNTASGDLSERKTDRKVLAGLLSNMANSLISESP